MQVKQILITGLGFVFLTVGTIGAFIPIWPTTPFVLLAVACFSSAPRIRAQIMKIQFFREYIVNYKQRTGLSKKTFWSSMTWLWGMLILSILFTRDLRVTLLLLFIGAAVTLHICCMARARRGSEWE